jgi:hypothetical protein
VDVVAGEDEEKALAEIRRTSHDLQFSDRSACKLGQRLAANSLLKASFVKAGSGKRLLLQLFSAETGCLNASAGVFWNETKPDLSVAEVVAELVNNQRMRVELPSGAAPSTVKEREIGERADGWELEGTSGVIVAFESEPASAVLLLDGKVLCMATPCSRLVAPGAHQLELQLVSYLPVRESVTVNEGTGIVKRALTPDFGWLTVRSKPAGLDVTLDEKPLGTTPVKRRQVSSGPHRVLVSDLSYFDKGKEIVIVRGEHEEVEVELSAREGGLQVHARDRRGNDLQASVLVDGREVGHTPFSGKVIVGDHRVRVALSDKLWEKDVKVMEKQVEKLDAVLDIGDAVPVPHQPTLGDQKRQFHLGLSMAEGAVFAGDTIARSGVSGAVSAWLNWGWFRWEPLTIGMVFEGAKPLIIGSGLAFDAFKGLYLRALFSIAIHEGKSYGGILTGVGYAFTLTPGLYLDTELDATFWPGKDLLVPLDARFGVRYAF